jgi:hypothetical protein
LKKIVLTTLENKATPATSSSWIFWVSIWFDSFAVENRKKTCSMPSIPNTKINEK